MPLPPASGSTGDPHSSAGGCTTPSICSLSPLYVCMSVYLCFLVRLLVIKLGSTLLQYDLDLITSAKPSFSNKVIF